MTRLGLVPEEGKDISIGGDTYIRFYSYKDVDKAGLSETHKTPDGEWCTGGVTFNLPITADLPGPKWTVNSIDPLDISPSVLCTECGHHGFIRQGVWVSC